MALEISEFSNLSSLQCLMDHLITCTPHTPEIFAFVNEISGFAMGGETNRLGCHMICVCNRVLLFISCNNFPQFRFENAYYHAKSPCIINKWPSSFLIIDKHNYYFFEKWIKSGDELVKKVWEQGRDEGVFKNEHHISHATSTSHTCIHIPTCGVY